MWLLRYSVLEFSFSGVFWGGRLACLDGSLARYVTTDTFIAVAKQSVNDTATMILMPIARFPR